MEFWGNNLELLPKAIGLTKGEWRNQAVLEPRPYSRWSILVKLLTVGFHLSKRDPIKNKDIFQQCFCEKKKNNKIFLLEIVK